MPVELAVAAYRFGRSLIRPSTFSARPALSTSSARPTAATQRRSPDSSRPGHPGKHPSRRSGLPARKPRKIDTKLSIPLSTLPDSAFPPPDPATHLALRNTLRGKVSAVGPEVAKAMRVPVYQTRRWAQRRARMGRRGTAVVLHREGGRAAAVPQLATLVPLTDCVDPCVWLPSWVRTAQDQPPVGLAPKTAPDPVRAPGRRRCSLPQLLISAAYALAGVQHYSRKRAASRACREVSWKHGDHQRRRQRHQA